MGSGLTHCARTITNDFDASNMRLGNFFFKKKCLEREEAWTWVYWLTNLLVYLANAYHIWLCTKELGKWTPEPQVLQISSLQKQAGAGGSYPTQSLWCSVWPSSWLPSPLHQVLGCFNISLENVCWRNLGFMFCWPCGSILEGNFFLAWSWTVNLLIPLSVK